MAIARSRRRVASRTLLFFLLERPRGSSLYVQADGLVSRRASLFAESRVRVSLHTVDVAGDDDDDEGQKENQENVAHDFLDLLLFHVDVLDP